MVCMVCTVAVLCLVTVSWGVLKYMMPTDLLRRGSYQRQILITSDKDIIAMLGNNFNPL